MNPFRTIPAFMNMWNLSTFMRGRMSGNQYAELTKKTNLAGRRFTRRLKTGVKWAQNVGLSLLTVPSLIFEFWGWNAVFNREISEHGDVDQAVAVADISIKKTQPAAEPGDLPTIQRSDKTADMVMTLLATYSIQKQADNGFMARAMKESLFPGEGKAPKIGVADAFSFAFASWLVAPVFPMIMSMVVYALSDDDDDDLFKQLVTLLKPVGDDGLRAGGFAWEAAWYQIQGVPFSRDVKFLLESTASRGEGLPPLERARLGFREAARKGASTSISKIFDAAWTTADGIFDMIEGIESGDEDQRSRGLWAMSTLLSLRFGFDPNRVRRDLERGLRQHEDGESFITVLAPMTRDMQEAANE
jgi:hypothetical protein